MSTWLILNLPEKRCHQLFSAYHFFGEQSVLKVSGLMLSAIRSILLLDTAKRSEYISDQCATIGPIEDAVSAVEPHRKGNRMKNTFMILWAPGPAWVSGKTVRNQPYWAQHAAFMDRHFENGTVVLGGPFADATGSLVIVEAENEHEVADLFASDPFVVHDIFVLSSLKQWLLFLDARRQG